MLRSGERLTRVKRDPSNLNLSPEERLLLVCTRLHLTQEQRDELNTLLAGPLSWEQVLYKAHWHGLGPMLFHHLRQQEQLSRIPTEAAHQITAIYLANVSRNLSFEAELRRALAALHQQGIRVILLKGAALASTVYQDIGLRPMADLDLLVSEAQVHLAQAIIQGLGYRPVGTPEAQEETEKDHRHLPGLVLTRDGTSVLVEVHRHIVRRDSALHFDIGGFWARAQEVSVAGTRALALAPEDLLIHLALNFFLDRRFHSQAALRQLCDIAESISYYQDSMDWRLFTDNVEEYQLNGTVSCPLYLAQELLGAQILGEMAQRLWPGGFKEREVGRFLRRRVMDTRTWVARGLAKPGSEYRPGGVAVAALRRLVPTRHYLATHSSIAAGRTHTLYLARVWKGLQILWRAALRPHEMIEDLAIDRWHHSLFGRQGTQEAKRGKGLEACSTAETRRTSPNVTMPQ